MVHGSGTPHKPARVNALQPTAGGMSVQLLRNWSLPFPFRLLWMLLAASALPLSVAGAAGSERTITIQPDAGVRFFNSDVGLDPSASVGIRLDLGVTDRVAVGIDYIFSSPHRKDTGQLANVDALRALARVDLLGGSTRPYIEAGIGGLSFNFTDAVDYGTTAGTLGVGVTHRLGTHQVVILNASGDLYQTRIENYDITGRLMSIGPARWNRLANISAGIGYRF